MNPDTIAKLVRQAQEGRKLERIKLDITLPTETPSDWGSDARNANIVVTVQPVYDAVAHELTLTDPRPNSFEISKLFGRDENGNLAATFNLEEMGIPRP